jgi:large subunit ribosomal protein L6
MFEKVTNTLVLPSKTQLYFISIKNISVLVVETPYLTKKYIKLPSFFKFKKSDNLLTFEGIKKETFFSLVTSWFKKFSKPFKKQLILKGLGFKGNIIESGSVLEFKLGFSHTVRIPLDFKELKFSMVNNVLTVEGFESYKVGNFLEKVRKLKKFDSYKGKGFWYKNEARTLKEIKKM